MHKPSPKHRSSRCVALDSSIDTSLSTEVVEGIQALKNYFGADYASVLSEVTPRQGELASFDLILPTDYLEVDRVLQIGFPRTFPNKGLNLSLTPGPGLDWPHNLNDTLCLFGIGQNPPYGDSTDVVIETMIRLGDLIKVVIKDGDSARLLEEFQSEIINFWQHQLTRTNQQLILLNLPESSCELMALTDQRWRPSLGEQYVWLGRTAESIQNHLARLSSDTNFKINAPGKAAYYMVLETIPNVKIPKLSNIVDWLKPHVTEADATSFNQWLKGSSGYPLRWLILKLPNSSLVLQAIAIRQNGLKPSSSITYGKRADKRFGHTNKPNLNGSLFYTPVHVTDPVLIHSRNPTYATSAINKKKVLMVGVGSLGSKVTLELIKEGVEHIHLVDPDFLADANLGRHVLGADDLGRNKTVALREMINRDMPLVQVTINDDFLETVVLDKPSFLDQFDLIVITTANAWSEAFLWRVFKSKGAKWALVQAWSEPYAFVGHALAAPSQQSADATSLFDASGNFKYAFTEFPDHGHIPLPGCGIGFIPGGPLGMSQIAAMTTQLALDCLADNVKRPTWRYWIGNSTLASEYKGKYIGPATDGVVSATFSKTWPDFST